MVGRGGSLLNFIINVRDLESWPFLTSLVHVVMLYPLDNDPGDCCSSSFLISLMGEGVLYGSSNYLDALTTPYLFSQVLCWLWYIYHIFCSQFLIVAFRPYAHSSLECPKFVRVLINLITSVQFSSNMNKLIVGEQFISNSTYKFQCKMPAIRADRFLLQSSKFHLEVSCLCLWSIQFQLFCECRYPLFVTSIVYLLCNLIQIKSETVYELGSFFRIGL